MADLGLHPASLACGAGLLVFYTSFSYALQLWYYAVRAGDRRRWKVQPRRTESVTAVVSGAWWIPRLPLLGLLGLLPHRADQPRLHHIVGTVNLLAAAAFAVATVEAVLRGASALELSAAPPPASRLAVEATVLLLLHQLGEYHWHRLMHTRPCYRGAHKLHHALTAPAPFDDMVIHPLEACGYYAIMWSPPFVARMLTAAAAAALPSRAAAMVAAAVRAAPGIGAIHAWSFGAYLAVVGVCGILDHSGVRLAVPLLYDTVDHDAHHEHFNVNFAFPFPLMDVLHGTYRGSLGGLTFDGRGDPRPLEWRGGGGGHVTPGPTGAPSNDAVAPAAASAPPVVHAPDQAAMRRRSRRA